MRRFYDIFISDVDECSQDKTPCGANEECLNEQGTYSCVCLSGYKKQNKVCVKKGELFIKLSTIDQFIVVCSLIWPLNCSEGGSDLVLIKSSLRLLSKPSCY